MLEIKVPTSFSLWPSNNVTALAFKSVFLDHTPPNTHTWYFSIYSSMQPWNLINKPHFHTMHSGWCTLNVKLIRREKDGFCRRYSLAHPGAQPGTLCRARAACWWPLLGWEVENRTHREGCFSLLLIQMETKCCESASRHHGDLSACVKPVRPRSKSGLPWGNGALRVQALNCRGIAEHLITVRHF